MSTDSALCAIGTVNIIAKFIDGTDERNTEENRKTRAICQRKNCDIHNMYELRLRIVTACGVVNVIDTPYSEY